MLIRLLVILSIIIGACIPSFADEILFRHYTTEEGLPSNRVRDLVQDDDGFIWMATDGGVVRFDGNRFYGYTLKAADDDPDDNYAMALCSINGILFVGTDSHLYRYIPETNDFQVVEIICEGKQINRLNVRAITPDNDGNLWVIGFNNGVYQLLLSSSQLQENIIGKHYNFPQFNNFVGSVFIDSRNDIWVLSNQNRGELMRLDKSSDKFRQYTALNSNSNSLVMVEDADKHLWLGTWDDGLVCFDPYSGNILYRTEASERSKFSHIHSMVVMPDQRLLIGSDAGLVIYDLRSNTFTNHIPDPTDLYSISDRFIYPIIVDREGGVWIGTFYGGVNYFGPDLKKFDRYAPGGRGSISGSVVSCMKEDSNGNIWVSSDDGGLNKYNPAIDTFTRIHLAADRSGAEPTNLHALCFDNEILWIGTYAHGVLTYNMANGKCHYYEHSAADDRSLPTNSSYAIYRDGLNRIWVASGSWACLYNRGSDDFRRLYNLQSQIYDIDEDVDGCLWFSTQGNGLWKYNPVRQSWTNYRIDRGLAHNDINCTYLDSRNNLYVATVNGLCKYNRQKDCFETLPTSSGNHSVLAIVEDQDVLWLSTEMGLVKYNEAGTFEAFTKSDGLTSSQLMPNTILKASNGRIYVGSRSGVTAFFPYQIQANTKLPNVVITSLEIPNVESTIHDITHVKKFYLNPEEYTFSLSFAALSYTNPEKNQYSYMLEGFDKDWIRVGSDNKATYTNLPSGKYKFHVIASNSDNQWNRTGATVDIEVLSPWYLTWPMKILYAILGIGIVYLAIRQLMKRKDKKHKVEINRINNDKELEVYQAKVSFFTTIAHEIRTPVSLIIGPLEKIMKSTELMSPSLFRDLNVIERNSQRLLTLVNQLLDFKKVEETGLAYRFRPTDIKSLLMSIADRFYPTMEQKGIILDVKYNVDDDFMADVDAEAITKMISNLLNNAQKFTKDYVSLSLSVNKSMNTFVIVVSDNGVGISKENQSKIFQPFYQVTEDNSQSKGGTGLGLSIVNSVVEGHGGNISIDSALDCGTSFIVTLPINQANLVEESHHDPSDFKDEKSTVEVSATPDDSSNRKSAKLTLLVVDDNEELCTFIANSFEDKYDVVTAPDGMKAIDILKTRNVNFIISDWMMPIMDGVELCRNVRSDRNISHIPFILLTAKTDNMSRIEGLNCGADAYVDKPFSIQVLEARIENLLNMRELLRKKFSSSPLEPLSSVAPNPADNQLLTQLTKVIEDNFSNPEIDIDFLAAKLDISRSGLYNKIKSLIDVTPNDLIRITRLKHAAKLLSQRKYRINEVCYMVGFNNTSYFSKCFLKQFGMTPTEFIANSVNEDQSTNPVS